MFLRFGCSLATLNNINNPEEQNIIDVPRDDSVISLKDSYSELKFDAKQTKTADFLKAAYVVLLNLGPIA